MNVTDNLAGSVAGSVAGCFYRYRIDLNIYLHVAAFETVGLLAGSAAG
jgi:hypothetical protein